MSTTADDPQYRLATYGTLAPGRVNHHQLADLAGQWLSGFVYGHLEEAGWGAEHGYPGLHLDPEGDAVQVHLFQSDDLPEHWDRLDAFEGDGYRRVQVNVSIDTGSVAAYLYVLNKSAG
ncbi:MAG: gamma-glutamylcyclotransferase [Pseudomonadota bacterium]